MGLWSGWVLRRTTSNGSGDRIWMTQPDKLDGLCREVATHLADRRLVIAVAHFPSTLAEMSRQLADRGVPHTVIEGSPPAGELLEQIKGNYPRRAVLVLASALPTRFRRLRLKDCPGLAVLVAERHFLHVKDDQVFRFARRMKIRGYMTFHLSLNDPLLRQFTGRWVDNLLTQLTKSRSNCIMSNLLERGIRRDRDRLAEQLDYEQAADSAEQWLKFNVWERAG